MPVATLAVAAIAGAVAARVEEVRLVTVGSRSAVELRVSGPAPRVTLRREGEMSRVALEGAVLGGPFAAADLFEWAPQDATSAPPPGFLAVGVLRIQKETGGVTVSFRVRSDVSIEVRRRPSAVTLVLAESGAPPPAPVATAAVTPAPEPPREPAPPAEPVAAEAAPEGPALEAPAPAPPVAEKAGPVAAADVEAGSELVRRLFLAAPPADAGEPQAGSVDSLYGRLFPFAPSETQTPAVTNAEVGAAPPGPRTLTLGAVTLHPSLRIGYVSGRTTLESARPVSADYVQVQPALELETAVGNGRLTVGYDPSLRGASSYDVLDEPTHRLGAKLALPVGARSEVKATGALTSGVLETQEVDPGYEYFFGLSRFTRKSAAANGTFEVAPRVSLEAGAAAGTVDLDQPVGFFSFQSRSALLGLGFELTPNLKATLGYVYDRVPPPDQRPLAEATAHSVQTTLSGEITPLLSGQITLAYRDQTSPQATVDGRRYRGLTGAASLTRALGDVSWLTLSAGRATPVSAFEANAFYVSTHVDARVVLPLPAGLSVEAGLGHRWNDYRTPASGLGAPREDRILGWRAGLRRTLRGVAGLAALYRRDRRQSNLPEFDSTTGGLIVQLELNAVGSGGYR